MGGSVSDLINKNDNAVLEFLKDIKSQNDLKYVYNDGVPDLDTVSGRTKEALRKLKDDGRHTGCAPYGFEINAEGKLSPLKSHIDIIKLIYNMKLENKALRTIADYLNLNNIVTARKGGRWHPMTVKNIVERYEKYTNILTKH